MAGFIIRKGQSVRMRLSMMSGGVQSDFTGGQWDIVDTNFRIRPKIETLPDVAVVSWTKEQTEQMMIGRKRLRLRYTQPNGEAPVVFEIWGEVV